MRLIRFLLRLLRWMFRTRRRPLIVLIGVLLIAAPLSAWIERLTRFYGAPPLPTYDLVLEMTARWCGEVHAQWDRDWEAVIAALEALHAQKSDCGDGKSPFEQLYPAYYNYGAWLEKQGRINEALSAYQKALEIQPGGREAALALRRRGALTPVALEICPPSEVEAALAAIPPYIPSGISWFVHLEGGMLTVKGAPYRIRGVNYYPSRAPWRRFLTETDLETVGAELDLIQGAGLNTIRIFVWYEALFTCPGSGPVPKADVLARLDGIIRLAAEKGLRLIVTLNDLPDLLVTPLYTQPEAANAQTLYLVQRYRYEPAILAWDLRNEGDVDSVRGYTTTRTVIDWLRALALEVRAADPNHLITAGWNENPQITAGIVDFMSFHHWRSAENLRERIKQIRAVSDKPLLLEEVGYASPADTVERQMVNLRAALSTAEAEGLMGWLIWTAFDFPTSATCIPPACPSPDNSEHHFGLWRIDYSPKPAVEMLIREFGLP
ncbi:MAG: cellulase family glycosylhydrolase [Anaerolinea sp.]|nr:cellulase family glycosylhydrolase [Anaerolinea sp.]